MKLLDGDVKWLGGAQVAEDATLRDVGAAGDEP